MGRKLYKSRTNIKIDGVCSGVANYLGLDVTLVRLIWLAVVLFGGTGVIFYIVCACIMPREPQNLEYYVQDPVDRSNQN